MSDLPLFDGRTFNAGRDGSRLQAQLRAVRSYVSDGEWHTLADISAATGHPEASVSARLRDLRKPRWGGYDVQRKYLGNGFHAYRCWHL